jgi:hypothetical protein
MPFFQLASKTKPLYNDTEVCQDRIISQTKNKPGYINPDMYFMKIGRFIPH